MEVQVAAVRMDDRLNTADRRLRSYGAIPEPQDDIMHLIKNALLHLSVDIIARGRIGRDACLLKKLV
jgi:hypothetical protein